MSTNSINSSVSASSASSSANANIIARSNLRNKIIVAFDIETGGQCMCRHNIVSVGAAVVDYDTMTTLHKQRFPLPFCVEGFDKRTKREYWDNEEKFPGIKQACQTFFEEGKKLSFVKCVKTITDFFDKLFEEYGDRVVLVGDNVAYDYGWLSYYFACYVPAREMMTHHYVPMTAEEIEQATQEANAEQDDNRPANNNNQPPTHKSVYHGSIRCVSTIESILDMFCDDGRVRTARAAFKIPADVKHDHYPENDAEYIAYKYATLTNVLVQAFSNRGSDNDMEL